MSLYYWRYVALPWQDVGKLSETGEQLQRYKKKAPLLLGKRVKLHCRHLLIQESRKQNKRIHGFALWETV